MSIDELRLGNPLPSYSWPDLSWVPAPVWVGLAMEALLILVFVVTRTLVRR